MAHPGWRQSEGTESSRLHEPFSVRLLLSRVRAPTPTPRRLRTSNTGGYKAAVEGGGEEYRGRIRGILNYPVRL